MPGITSYPTAPAVGFQGQIADEAPRYVRKARNKEAAPIPFGLAVKKGTNEDEAILPTAGTDKVVGIAAHTHAMNTIGSTGWSADAGIPADEVFDLLRKGVVWVKVEQAVVQGDLAFVRFAAGAGGTQKGAFRKDADTATAMLVKGAVFLTGAAAGGLAQLEFDALTAQTT